MLVVRHDDGYALIEMLGDEGAITVSAQVRGDWNAVASEPIFCNGQRYDAFFQGNWPERETPIRLASGVG
jgi:hypothetical protein